MGTSSTKYRIKEVKARRRNQTKPIYLKGFLKRSSYYETKQSRFVNDVLSRYEEAIEKLSQE
jgi:hypothetical protein